MAGDDKIIGVLTEKGFIDGRNFYCAGAINKADVGYLFGALGGAASALNSMVYICLNADELIIVKLDMETELLRRKLSELKFEKVKTGFMGGKLLFRCDGKRFSFDCSNDFARGFAPIVGAEL